MAAGGGRHFLQRRHGVFLQYILQEPAGQLALYPGLRTGADAGGGFENPPQHAMEPLRPGLLRAVDQKNAPAGPPGGSGFRAAPDAGTGMARRGQRPLDWPQAAGKTINLDRTFRACARIRWVAQATRLWRWGARPPQ